MQRNMLIFTTVCCVFLAAINLFLNYQLYSLVRANASGVGELPPVSQTNESIADAAVFSNTNPARTFTETEVSDETNPEARSASVPEAQPLYMLGMKDGYIAVFYGSGGGTIVKEVTALPADALPFDEKLRLAQGIPVFNEGQLVKLLQDYGS